MDEPALVILLGRSQDEKERLAGVSEGGVVKIKTLGGYDKG